MLLVFLVAIVAIVLWLAVGRAKRAPHELLPILWLIVQVCALATALHYMNARI